MIKVITDFPGLQLEAHESHGFRDRIDNLKRDVSTTGWRPEKFLESLQINGLQAEFRVGEKAQ